MARLARYWLISCMGSMEMGGGSVVRVAMELLVTDAQSTSLPPRGRPSSSSLQVREGGWCDASTFLSLLFLYPSHLILFSPSSIPATSHSILLVPSPFLPLSHPPHSLLSFLCLYHFIFYLLSSSIPSTFFPFSMILVCEQDGIVVARGVCEGGGQERYGRNGSVYKGSI